MGQFINDEFLHILFDKSPDGVMIDDGTGRYIEVNTTLCEWLGYTRDEFINLKLEDLIDLESLQQIPLKWEEMKEGKTIAAERQLKLKNGSFLPVELTARSLPDGHYLIHVRDITSRKHSEARLKEEHDNLRAVMASTPVGLIVLDEDKRIVDANPEACRLFHQKIEALTDRYCGDFIGCINRTKDERGCGFASHCKVCNLMISIEKVLNENEGLHDHETEIIIESEIGNDISWLRFSMEPVFLNGHRHVVLALHDITHRMLAEQALIESEKLYDSFINKHTDIIFVKDDKLNYIVVNDAATSFFGKEKEEILHKTDFDLLEHDFALLCNNSDQLVLKSNSQVVVEEKILDRIFETTKFPLLLVGNKLGIGGIIRDITERTKAEEQVKKLNAELDQRVIERTDQLQEATKEMEAFAYSIAHDLRAPLRAIDGYTQIIKEDYEAALDDEGRRVLSIIRSSAQRMGQLIDDLLALSRLSRKELRFTEIDMEALFLSVYQELASPLLLNKIDLHLGTLSHANGDPTLIKQVLTNLISNALKFSSHQERISLSFSSTREADRVVFCIKDNGAGFDMNYVSKLFNVFQRLHSTSEFEGTGIGLAIVHRIISRHGGEVWAEGSVNKGASFYFTLHGKGILPGTKKKGKQDHSKIA
jgi:PAS domain S-box-containing protein